jgi:hypothetical protein
VRLRKYRRRSFAASVISSTSWHMNLRVIWAHMTIIIGR